MRNSIFILVAVPLLWAGMVAGISFLEAPLKFQAPGVTLKIGVGIGRLVFSAMNKIEIAFLLLWGLCSVRCKEGRLVLVPMLLTVSLLIVQTVLLLPALDARAELILSGSRPPSDMYHPLFIVCELVKMITLLLAAHRLLTKTPIYLTQNFNLQHD